MKVHNSPDRGAAWPASTPRAVLVAGSTGLVGRHLVRLLAADPGVTDVSLPVRRAVSAEAFAPAPRTAFKLRPVVVDFDHLEAHGALFAVQQLFVCLGTTLEVAGSREAFRRVDLEYALAVARAGAEQGALDLLVVTAVGSSPTSPFFYSRVKGELEEAAAALPYRSVTFFRPSLLLGAREVVRRGEIWGERLARLASPLFRGPFARYRPVTGAAVASAMAAVARSPRAGVRVVESDEIERIAALG